MILKMCTLELENDLIKDRSRNDVITISDPEDGEINDASDLEDITDISSEEEYLLKERIKVLENINLALEKKEARRLSLMTGSQHVKPAINLESLSEISSTTEDVIVKNDENTKSEVKPTNKSNKRKRKLRPRSAIVNPNANKKTRTKETKLLKNESSSSDSDDETAHQRRRLRNAVRISPVVKTQKSSLKSRLFCMIKAPEVTPNINHPDIIDMENANSVVEQFKLCDEDKILSSTKSLQYEALCTSDDDPEVLRQLALKSKSSRNLKNTELKLNLIADVKFDEINTNIDKHTTDDVDSDTAELRTIALKSAMLKKAMARKKRQKYERKKQLKLRRSITTTFSDDALEKAVDFSPLREVVNEAETDIEAVDMEINDEVDDHPIYENNIHDNLVYQQHPMAGVYDDYQYGEYSPQPDDQYLYNHYYDNNLVIEPAQNDNDTLEEIPKEPITQKDDDNEEDEEMLRAQLLSSMSKSVKTLPKKPIVSQENKETKVEVKEVAVKPGDTNFVIKLGDSDFDSECETTRNLITMHNKLKKQGEFEKNLEAFLKSARSKAENKLPPVHQDSVTIPAQVKHTPMAVKHLPESDQQEYRKLIKRMAELDKVRQARQLVLENSIKISQLNKKLPSSESIDGKNILIEMSNILHSTTNTQAISEQQIAISRQKISSQTNMLESLTKEGKTLQQKTELLAIQFRAVAASLQSSRAALSQNQHKVHAANRNLMRLRKQHQVLLTRSKSHSIKRGSYFSNIKFTKNTLLDDSSFKQKSISAESTKHIANLEKNVSKLVLDNNKNSQIARLIGSDKITNIPKENQKTKISVDHINNHRTLTQEVTRSKDNKKSCLQNMTDISKEETQLPICNIEVKDCSLLVKSPEISEEKLLDVIEENTKKSKVVVKPIEDKFKTKRNVIIDDKMCDDKQIIISSLTVGDESKNNSNEDSLRKEENILGNTGTEGYSLNLRISSIHTVPPSNDSQLAVSSKNCHSVEDYKSPLQFLHHSSAADIQAIFCPFEVDGSCNDPECKYYHPKI